MGRMDEEQAVFEQLILTLEQLSSMERLKPWFFVTFNIIISNIFSGNFIESHSKDQKISPLILFFIDFSDFLTFSCYKQINEVSI